VAGFLGRGRVKPGHKTVLDYVIMYTHTKVTRPRVASSAESESASVLSLSL
jgi:hypothetical protein